MKKILVLGSSGMLGKELQFFLSQLKATDDHWMFFDRSDLDLSHLDQIAVKINKIQPDLVLNLAAYTQVDQAESNKEAAYLLNHKVPEQLAACCQQLGAALLHISTDYVYGGAANQAFTERTPLRPVGVYGASKAAGEKAIIENTDQCIILRTSWLYGPHGNNFLNTMLRLGTERDSLQVVQDQIGTPTYTLDLCRAIYQIIGQFQAADSLPWGIYNYSNQGVASWYDFAWSIFHHAGVVCELFPVSTSAFPRPAPRPAFSLMSKEKISQTFDLSIPHWQDALLRCLKRRS